MCLTNAHRIEERTSEIATRYIAASMRLHRAPYPIIASTASRSPALPATVAKVLAKGVEDQTFLNAKNRGVRISLT